MAHNCHPVFTIQDVKESYVMFLRNIIKLYFI
jgi:hypothetical protein